MRRVAVVLRQEAARPREKKSPRPGLCRDHRPTQWAKEGNLTTLSAERVCIHGNSYTLMQGGGRGSGNNMDQPLWKTNGCLRSRNLTPRLHPSPVLLKHYLSSESPAGLVKTRIAGLRPQSSYFSGSGATEFAFLTSSKPVLVPLITSRTEKLLNQEFKYRRLYIAAISL